MADAIYREGNRVSTQRRAWHTYVPVKGKGGIDPKGQIPRSLSCASGRLDWLEATLDASPNCGHVLEHEPRSKEEENRFKSKITHGVPYEIDELLVRIDRYVHDICPDCEHHIDQCNCEV